MLIFSLWLGCSGRNGADANDPVTDGLVDDEVDLDVDGDGFEVGEDCDDNDADVHPDALEVLDGIDNDCNPSTCTGTGFKKKSSAHFLPAGYGTNQARYPFEAIMQIYGSCTSNYPEYSTFDLTGDGIPDMVITLSPCADDDTGGAQWLVHKGGDGGFEAEPIEWDLPPGYGTGAARFPFEATSNVYGSCTSNYPEYSTFDVTGDGQPDMVITLSPCANDATGGTRWLVHEGKARGFADEAIEWALPTGYGTNQFRVPFEATANFYGSCETNTPEYATFDITGDGFVDLVVTLAPCANDETGGSRWLVYEGGDGGFADEPTEWGLPTGYGNNQSRFPFEATSNVYGSCTANTPEYATFDITGDGKPDMVITLAPCADDQTGGLRWLVHEAKAKGFADTAIEWALPAGYGTGTSRYPFEATAQFYGSCTSNYPEYSTFDITGDKVPDLVVTLSPCADDVTGDTQWLVHEGLTGKGDEGFATIAMVWELPEAYGTNQSRFPFEATSQFYGSCESNYPEYTTFDVSGDGVPDLVVTLSPCADDVVGYSEWTVYEGMCDE